jgi:hypothetical protein
MQGHWFVRWENARERFQISRETFSTSTRSGTPLMTPGAFFVP